MDFRHSLINEYKQRIYSKTSQGFKNKYKLNAHEKDHKLGLILPEKTKVYYLKKNRYFNLGKLVKGRRKKHIFQNS